MHELHPPSAGFGLCIDGNLALPGAVPVADQPANWDVVRLRLGLPATPDTDRELYSLEGDELCFRPPGVATYRLQHGSVHIVPEPDADASNVTGLLIATALPGLLWMRGALVLHAAAVVMPGQQGAVAIIGKSGAGKSTLANQLVRQGARLVADDSLAISDDLGCSGLPGGLFIRSGDARQFHPLGKESWCLGAPLSAIVVLGREHGELPHRVDPVVGVQLLLEHRHRPAIPGILGKGAAVLAQVAQLAGAVPIFCWQPNYPSGRGNFQTVSKLTP